MVFGSGDGSTLQEGDTLGATNKTDRMTLTQQLLCAILLDLLAAET